ncbi:YihY/virulence factor BrkB family protein [Paludisphaera mucosa]|uniref:YihY/virulence factor BrkB family protein n=1 Tax=Paludisphaera mucosa TaxID=3030827 RepID=A0ABT6F6H4_9BACT|nr:YihY/virulence factor BrkB family protein [Paludisphaera mucosa]MDG3002995.1 YihY/virulence factor BrkB family protein [Paludisphaera mucosa]
MDLGGLTLRESLRRTWVKLNEHELMTRAAAITFYAVASLVPFLGLVALIAAHVLPWVSRDKNLDPSDFLNGILPAEAAKLLAGQLEDMRSRPNAGLVSFGTVALLWLNSSLFVAVMDAANRIMGVEERRPYWKQRLVAVFMAILEAVLLILVLASTLLWPQILGFLKLDAVSASLLTVVHGLSVLILVLVSFAVAMYFAPDAEQRWEWITPGSLLGSLLLVFVSYLFRFYVQRWGDYGATYGSLAGLVVLMSWIWLCSVELLAAAEFNKVIEDASPYGKDYGERTENPATRARAAGYLEAFFKQGPLKDPRGRMRSPVFTTYPTEPDPAPPGTEKPPAPTAPATEGEVDAGS